MIVALQIPVLIPRHSIVVCMVKTNSYFNKLHSLKKIIQSCLASVLLLQKTSLQQCYKHIVIETAYSFQALWTSTLFVCHISN